MGALDPANDNDYWSFAARQGDRLVVDAERTSGGISPRFYVYNAAGQILVNGDSYGSFGSPSKSTAAAYAIPADGTYYVRMGNQGGTGSYQFRVDLGRSVQLEPYDFGQANNSTGVASALAYAAGAPGHLAASVAGSLYSGEGLDYYALGRLDPGNRVDVASRTISVSGLTYKVQVVGASMGVLPDADGSQQDNRATVTVAQNDDYYLKVEAISGAGIRGQYLVDVDVQDTVPPRITSVTGIPAEGGTVGLHLNPITLSFSEDVQTAGVNAATTWDLRAAGADDQFGTPDDVVYTLSRSGGSRSVSLTVADGPLQPGAYRFTARAAGLLDRFGNPLDGDGDGTGGDDLVRTFAVAIPAGQVLESRSNDSIPAATPLPLAEDPAGSGFLTSLIAVGALDPANDNDYWSFAARQGDRLVVDAERTSGGISPRFYVYNAAGQILVNGDSYGSFGSPSKSTAAAYAIPADGTYYVRMGNQGGTGSYQFRVDLGRSVQLEPYDFGQANNSTGVASALAYAAGRRGTWRPAWPGRSTRARGWTTTRWAGSTRATGSTWPAARSPSAASPTRSRSSAPAWA